MKGAVKTLVYAMTLLLASCGENKIASENDSFFLGKQPQEVGFDSGFMESLNQQASELPNIYSFLVIKDKALVHEAYFNGSSAESLLHIRSITKSVSSIMIGKALAQGAISDLDESLSSYYDDYIEEERGDKLDQVTLSHVLDMQTGFDWNEGSEAISWYTSISDTWTYFFEKEVLIDPGTAFNYNSGAVSLLTRFIENNQTLTYEAYAVNNLFDPLHISDFSWEKDGLGNTRADAGLQLRALDLAKIGYIMMHEGKVDNQQVIPPEWIDDSWKFEIDLNGSYGPIQNLHYNNLWWMGEYNDHQVFFGLGYGGQLLLCVPDHDLIVITNHEFRLPGNVVTSHSREFLDQVFKKIMDQL